MKPPQRPKPRRLRAALEPDLPEAGIGDDPRSALHTLIKRNSGGMNRNQDGSIRTKVVRTTEDASVAELLGPCVAQNIRDTASYAELHCLSNFSFQRGASSAQELFQRAKKFGYRALAITDECSLAGIVRALEASNESGLALIVGTEVQLADGPKLVLLARNQDGYTDICKLITTGRRRSAKGEYHLTRLDVELLGDGVLVLAVCATHLEWVVQHFHGRAWLAVELHRGPDDAARLAALRNLAAQHDLPLVAAGDVHMHQRRRRALQDLMTAIRIGRTIAEAGHALFPNGERHLRKINDLAALYPDDLLAETLRIASLCTFDLHKLNYHYPTELVPDGMTAIDHLREKTWKGAAKHWPVGVPGNVQAQLEKELVLIAELEYEHFFLTVEDIVHWARKQNPPILCQGRGSSANSAVCYCLGITVVTPQN
ncbi:MAG: PHP domain-containing protein, partial [Dokdonella sp.]